jgi:hypothetical protein
MNYKLMALFAIIATFGLFGASVTSTMSAYAIHNDKGHSDKLSLGECYRLTSEENPKEYCKENKELWQGKD